LPKFVKAFNTQSQQSGTGMRMDKNGSMTPLNKTTKVGADGLTPYAREKFGAAVDRQSARTKKSTLGTGGLSGAV
jgi:hypothetical protein